MVDVTLPEKPRAASRARACRSPTRARVYVARTYAYVAGGQGGPRHRRRRDARSSRACITKFTADGKLDDARDVIVASTNASLFAYVADGKNGLKVVQLTSPDTQPRFYGFSPEPRPQLDRLARDRLARARARQGPRPRPRRRRDRRPDRGLRPHRLAAVHAGGAAKRFYLRAGRNGLDGERTEESRRPR